MEGAEAIGALASIDPLTIGADGTDGADRASLVLTASTVSVPLAGVVDVGAEIERLEAELASLSASAERLERRLADRQFLTVLQRLTNLDAFSYENAILLTDENIRRYPFLYALEVGYMSLSPGEIEGLRDYLKAGGFLVIDDFWGTREWDQFEYQMSRVFPQHPIIDLELDHPVFNTFYDIDEILQVPAYGRFWRGQTFERDGYVPHVKGILDDDGRLMVIINWNTDLGDAWEWAEQPDYPVQYSTFAFQMGVNMIIYAMSH